MHRNEPLAVGPQAESAIPRLLAALTKAVIDANGSEETLADTLIAIAPDPEQCVRDHLAEIDPELRRQTIAAIRERVAAGKEQAEVGS